MSIQLLRGGDSLVARRSRISGLKSMILAPAAAAPQRGLNVGVVKDEDGLR